MEKKSAEIRGTDSTGHLEEVRRTWIFPGAPCQGVSRTEGPTKVDEQVKGQPLAGCFFLESSVEDKGYD